MSGRLLARAVSARSNLPRERNRFAARKSFIAPLIAVWAYCEQPIQSGGLRCEINGLDLRVLAILLLLERIVLPPLSSNIC